MTKMAAVSAEETLVRVEAAFGPCRVFALPPLRHRRTRRRHLHSHRKSQIAAAGIKQAKNMYDGRGEMIMNLNRSV